MYAAIAKLFSYDGPFVTVYLDARSDQPQAQQVLEARWKAVRADLAVNHAPEGALVAIDAELARRDHVGGDTLAIIAAGDHVVLARHLPEPPARDIGKVGKVPWIGPLLDAAQTMIPHLVVVADGSGVHVTAVTAGGQELSHDAPTEAAASDIASLVKDLQAGVVLVSGDVHAVRRLTDALPPDVADLVRDVDGDDPVQAAHLVANVAAEHTVALLERFKAEKGRHDRAADGPAATIEALQRGAVDTLLVHDDADDMRPAWFGAEPTQIALARETLEAMGATDLQCCRLVDVAIRAAVGTSADVRVVPAAVLTEGLGAILRF